MVLWLTLWIDLQKIKMMVIKTHVRRTLEFPFRELWYPIIVTSGYMAVKKAKLARKKDAAKSMHFKIWNLALGSG